MITGWGHAPYAQHVHYYSEIDGLRICRKPRSAKIKATLSLPRWDPKHPNTCEKCKKKYVKYIAEQGPAVEIGLEGDVNV